MICLIFVVLFATVFCLSDESAIERFNELVGPNSVDWKTLVNELKAEYPRLFLNPECNDRHVTFGKKSGRSGWTNQHAAIMIRFENVIRKHGSVARLPECCMVTRATFLDTHIGAFSNPYELPLTAFYDVPVAMKFWQSFGAFKESKNCSIKPAPWNARAEKNAPMMQFLSWGLVHYADVVVKLAKEIIRNLPAEYVGYHLRWEYDACCFRGLALDFNLAALNQLQNNSVIYVASGLHEHGSSESRYNQRARHMWHSLIGSSGKKVRLVDKNTLLSERSLSMMHSIPLETHAQIDSLVLLRATHFVGNTWSSLSMNIVYLRGLLGRFSTVSDMNWKYIPWTRPPKVLPFLKQALTNDFQALQATWTKEMCDSLNNTNFVCSRTIKNLAICDLMENQMSI